MTILNDTKLAYLEALAAEDLAGQKQIVEYRKYYDGDHDTYLIERLRHFLGFDANKKFRLNQCPVVVESLVERLALSGFEEIGEDVSKTDEELGNSPQQAGLIEFAQKLLEDNRIDAQQENLYRQAAIDWIAYLVLDIDPETGLITLNLNDAYTNPGAGGDDDGVKLHYANVKRRGQPVYATKRWSTLEAGGEAVRHLVVYYPDRIERYISDKKAIEMFSEAGWRKDKAESGPLAKVWPQPWIDAGGKPLGIPVIPFVNGQASELHEVIPVQKALNKSFIDLVAGGDLAGFGILFAAGWVPTSDGKAITVDDTGKVTSKNTPLNIEQGAIFYSTNPDARLERVPGDDLDKLVRLVDSHFQRIAQVSRTPVTNFQLFGQIPAEGTQKQLEVGLVAKAKSRQQVYGNAWEDAIYLARRVALGAPVYQDGEIVSYGLEAYQAFGLEAAEGTRVSALWQDAATRNEKELLETLQLKDALGVPKEQLFLEMGYTAEQAQKFAGEAEAKRLAGEKLVADRLAAMNNPPGAGINGEQSTTETATENAGQAAQ